MGLGLVRGRYLMDSYTRQSVIVQWDGCRSTSFRVMNWVKQGGVLSPMLFAIYIDVLLLQLGTSGLGCYIDNVCFGALGYADDIVIISPSIRSLNEIIRVCESYADEYSLLPLNLARILNIIAMSYLMGMET